MKKGFLTALCLGIALVFPTMAFAAAIINGAGATFPNPLYSRWTYEYNKITGIKINYQSIGSGGGIRQIKAKTVDFGASDAPLKPEKLEASGLIQFPMAIGGVVPVVNISGINPGDMKLTPEVLADIYLGKIKKWDDPAIKALNQGLKLPSMDITVVHRADGSGTTWIFTNYLYKVSKTWNNRVGFGTAVRWPVGIGGKGNEGVAAYVKRINGAIGYLEFAYAIQNKLSHARLKNKSGYFIDPAIKSFRAAAAVADWKNAPGYYVILTDQKGKNTWPIAGATFILMYKRQTDCEKAKNLLEFFDWAYQNGSKTAISLKYVPVPKNVYTIMEKTWAKVITCNEKPVWSR